MLALRGVSLTCPGSLAPCWVLWEINAKTPSPVFLELFLRWYRAFICERWRQVWGWRVLSGLEERRKRGGPSPSLGHSCAKSNHPEPSQGGWWFSHPRDEKQKPGKAQGYPTSEGLSWLLSQRLTPELILLQYSAGFSRKEARKGHRNKRPLPPPPPPLQSIPFALHSAHFLILAAIIIISYSFPKWFSSWQNLELLLLGALQKESTLEQHALVPKYSEHPWFMPPAEEASCRHSAEALGWLDGPFFLGCIIARGWHQMAQPLYS